MTGMYRGGVFVMMPRVCIFMVGLPSMVAKTLSGRRGRRRPVKTLVIESGASAEWSWTSSISMLVPVGRVCRRVEQMIAGILFRQVIVL